MNDRIRLLTETNLGRITKGCEANGFAIIRIPKIADPGKTDTAAKELKRYLTRCKSSYIIIYGGSPDRERTKASMDRFFVVFPYSITKRTVIDFQSFEKVTDGLAAAQASGVSVIARIGPVPRQTFMDKEPFFSQITRLCRDAAGNGSRDYALYIDDPPASMQVAHARWAAGNMNHIYKEIKP